MSDLVEGIDERISRLYSRFWGHQEKNKVYKSITYDGPDVIEYEEGDTQKIESKQFEYIDVGPDAVLPTNLQRLLIRPEYKQMISKLNEISSSFAVLGGPGIGKAVADMSLLRS